MGSITHVVDTEKVLNEYEYDTWGEVTHQRETIENRFKFNGQQLDPITGQYYLRARFYNPVIARFTQEDTYRGDGLNLYAYCRNNPVYYVDPTGNATQCMKDAYSKAREAGMSKEDAYKAAKEAYKNNHTDTNQRPTVDVPSDGSITRAEREQAYSQARAAANNPSSLTYLGNNTWQSNGGLIYGNDKTHGNKVQHVLAHTVPDTNKKQKHTVFNVDRSELIGVVDEAWSKGVVDSKDSAAYVANMGRVIGTNGEMKVRVVVLPNGRILSAYPVQ